MAQLSKDDLRQMNRGYFQSLSKERLVEVANNLHQLAVDQWEKINSNSSNSSQAPSSDNPWKKAKSSLTSTPDSSLSSVKIQLVRKEKYFCTANSNRIKAEKKARKTKGVIHDLVGVNHSKQPLSFPTIRINVVLVIKH